MTEYSQYIDGLLKPKVQEPAVVLDLFAGCGGLSLGFEAVGFRTIGFEMVDEAVDTYNRNLKGKCYNQFLEVGFNYPEEENIDIELMNIKLNWKTLKKWVLFLNIICIV